MSLLPLRRAVGPGDQGEHVADLLGVVLRLRVRQLQQRLRHGDPGRAEQALGGEPGRDEQLVRGPAAGAGADPDPGQAAGCQPAPSRATARCTGAGRAVWALVTDQHVLSDQGTGITESLYRVFH